MKYSFALLTGSLLLCHGGPTLAQSGGPAGVLSGSLLVRSLRALCINAQQKSHTDSFIVHGTPAARNIEKPPDEPLLRSQCALLAGEKRRIYYLTDRSYRMSLQVRGIYVREDILFFQLSLSNHSPLDYDIDSIRFLITDKQPPRKGPAQALSLQPVYAYGNTEVVRGKSSEISVFAFRKFTLPSSKRMVLQVTEKNGGRELQVQTDNLSLVRARSF